MNETLRRNPGIGLNKFSDRARRTLEPYLPAGKTLEDLSIEELQSLDNLTKPGSSIGYCVAGGTSDWHEAFQERVGLLIGARANALSLQAGIGDPDERAQMVDPDSETHDVDDFLI